MLIIITGSGENQWVRERKLSRSGWDETVEDVAAGEWTDIASIQHMALGGRDVTGIIAAEVARIWHEDAAIDGVTFSNWPQWKQDFLTDHLPRVRKMQAAE